MSIFDRFLGDCGANLGSKIDQKSMPEGVESAINKRRASGAQKNQSRVDMGWGASLFGGEVRAIEQKS